MTRRVVITGSGYICGAGIGKDVLYTALREGKSAVRSIEGLFEGVVMKLAAPIPDFNPEDFFEPAKVKNQLDPFSQHALIAAREVVKDSGLPDDEETLEHTAVILGSSIGGLHTVDENYAKYRKRPHPMTIPKLMASAPASQVAMEFGCHGPSFSTGSACSSSAHAIAQAVMMIRAGIANSAIAGGTEATHLETNYKAWDSLRVASRSLCRPFSANRNGLVLGEGAALYVLEEYETAKKRGANILAEIIGVGMSSDAGDLVAPDPKWISTAMTRCLKDAKLNPEDVDYINAHGTGTKLNDLTETNAIKTVFGDHAYNLKISSTKPIHGHTLGAAAGIELASLLLAMNENVIAPTINYEEPDPECDLDYVPNEAQEANVDVALCNSFAFGGLNAVLGLRKCS